MLHCLVVDKNVNQNKTFKVGISGSYGGLNIGDEAILQGIITRLRASLPVKITIFSRDAKDTLQRHQVEQAVTARDLTREEVTQQIEGQPVHSGWGWHPV